MVPDPRSARGAYNLQSISGCAKRVWQRETKPVHGVEYSCRISSRITEGHKQSWESYFMKVIYYILLVTLARKVT